MEVTLEQIRREKKRLSALIGIEYKKPDSNREVMEDLGLELFIEYKKEAEITGVAYFHRKSAYRKERGWSLTSPSFALASAGKQGESLRTKFAPA